MFLQTNKQHSSISEPSLEEEEELKDYFEDKGRDKGKDNGEDDDDAKDQQLVLPAYFLGVPLFRHRNRDGASSSATEPESSAQESNTDGITGLESISGILPLKAEAQGAGDLLLHCVHTDLFEWDVAVNELLTGCPGNERLLC